MNNDTKIKKKQLIFKLINQPTQQKIINQKIEVIGKMCI
jgi:hypothetical protein